MAAAALLLVGVLAFVAFAQVAKSPQVHKGAPPAPRALKYACASDLYNAKDVLHFVARTSNCKGSGKKLVKFADDYPVYVCRKEHGGFVSSARARRFPYPLGIRAWGPAGLIRMVSDPSRCAPRTQPNETPVTLPQVTTRLFCAAKKGGELRWITKVKNCDKKEFPVKLASRGPSVGSGNGEVKAGADTATTDENSATTISVLANDSGPGSSSGLVVDSTDTTGTVGKVTVNANNTITYDTDGKFEALKAGQTATDTFKYKARKNSVKSGDATVTVTITGVNDAPVAVDDSATTDEDHTKSISVLSNDTDKEGDSLTAGSLDTTGTQGTATVNGDGTITYDPNHKFDSLQGAQTATDTFKYKANDGSANSNAATVTVTLTAVNDAPVLSGIESAKLNYLEGSAGAPITGAIAVADIDDANVHSATVTLGAGRDAADALHFANQSGITGSAYDSSTGVLTLTGSASKANYQTALRSVTFDSAGGASGDRTISFQIEDGEAANKDSNVVSRIVTVDKAPVAQNDPTPPGPPTSISLGEDSGANTIDVLANDSDGGDGGPKTIISKTDGTNGTVAITNSGADLTYTPALNFCGSDSFPYTLIGGSSATVNVTVNCVNDAPVNTVPGAQTVNEDGNIVFSNAFSVADVDAAADSIQTTLAVPNGTITASGGGGAVVTGNGTSSVQITGSLTDVNSKLSSVTYAPDANVNGSRTISMDTDDQAHNGSGGNKTDHDTVDVTINAVNDAPVNTVSGAQAVDEDTTLTFTPSPSTQDVDAGAGGVKVTLGVDHGTLTLSGTSGLTFTTGDGTNDATMTFTGTVAQVNAALLGLAYKGNLNYNGSDTLTLTTDDEGRTGSGGALSDTDTVGITVNAVNDAPLNTVPGAQSTNEDTAKVFSTAGGNAMSVSDVDVAPGNLKITLSASHGAMTLSGTAGLAFTTGTGTSDTQMVFTGTPSAINSALNGLSFAPAPNYDGPAQIELKAEDQGNTGSGGNLQDDDIVDVNVVAQNDAPVNTVPGTQSVNEDTPLVVTPSPSIADSDAAGASVKVTLSDLSGGLTLSGTTGLTFTSGDGTGDQTMTFTGTVADVNNALAGLVYQGNLNFNGTDTVTLKTEDQGNTGAGGNQIDTDTFDVNVSAVNDGPANSVPGAQTTDEDTANVFSSGNSNALSIADVDSDPSSVQVSLTVTSGVLTLSGTSGLSFTSGDGTTDATMTFTGTQSAINTALNGLSYQPNANYFGSDSLQIVTNDQGNTGSGGAQSDTDNVGITVSAVNDGPANTVPGDQSTNEDTSFPFNSSVTDIDAGGSDVKISLSVLHGKLSLGTTLGLTFTDGTSNNSATVKFTGTLAAVNAAMTGITYAPDQDYFGGDTFTMVSDDQGNTGTPGALTDTDTFAITVTAVNDAPALDLDSTDGSASTGTTSTFNEEPTHTLPGPALAPNATLTDVDDDNINSATVTLTNDPRPDGDANESLSADTSGFPNITATYTQGTGVLAITSATPQPKADYLAVLKTVKYNNTKTVPNAADRIIQFKVNDGEVDSNIATATVKVVPIDVPPTLDLDSSNNLSLDSSASYTEDGPDAAIAPNADINDTDDTDMDSATITLAAGTPPDGASESLLVTIPGGSGITIENGSYQSGTGVLKLVGPSSIANYESAIQSIKYRNISDTPSTASRSIDVVVNDGVQDSNHQTSTVSVTANNDAPVNGVPGTQSATEDTTKLFSTANSNALSISDVDAGSNPVQVTLSIDDGTISLSSSAGLSFTTGDGNADTTMTFTGTISDINSALSAGVGYSPSSNFASAAHLQIVTNDQGNTGAGGAKSDTDSVTINVGAVNDAPVNTKPGPQSVDEDTALVFSAGNGNPISISDVDAGSNAVQVTLSVADGGLTLNGLTGLSFTTGDGTGDPTMVFSGTITDINNALNGLSYQGTLNFNGNDSLSITTDDQGNSGSGGPQSATDGVPITVGAVNDAPSNSVPGTQTFNEDTSRTFNSTNGNLVTVSDVDAASGNVTTTLTATNGTVTLGSTASLTVGGNGTGTVTLTGTIGNVNNGLDGMTFTPTADFNGSAQINVNTNDNGNTGSGGSQSDSDNIALTLNAVNDAPQNTVPGPQTTVLEDTAFTFSSGNGNLISTSDVDAAATPVRVTFSAVHGGLTLNGIAGLTFACGGCAGDGTGDATMTFEGTVSAVNTALSGASYLGTLNYNGPDTITLIVNDKGATGSGGALSDTDTIALTVNPVNDTPVAGDESFTSTSGPASSDQRAVGNTTLDVNDTTNHPSADGRIATPDPTDTGAVTDRPHKDITGDILANDTDVDNTSSQLTVTAGTFATNAGGSVTIQSDGDFTFEPKAGTSCTDPSDFFDYTVSDNVSSGAGPNPGTDTGRVTINQTGCVWYVNNDDTTPFPGGPVNPNSGTSEQPFDTLAQAESNSAIGDSIFVYDGNNTTTGYGTGITLKTNQQLIGEAATLTVGTDTLHSADSANRPTLTKLNADVVSMVSGNSLKGLGIDPQGTGGGVSGTGFANATTATISDVDITDTGTKGSEPGLELTTNNAGATTNVSNLTVNNGDASEVTSADIGVRLNSAGTVNFASAGQNSIVTNGAEGLDVSGTNMGTGSVFDGIIVSNSGSGGVSLSSAAGTTTFGDDNGTDLSLTTTSGTAAAFKVASSGTVTVGSLGGDDVHATGGPAVDITGTAGGTYDFDDVDSTNSSGDGINLAGLGSGGFVANSSSTISAQAGVGFDLDGGSGTVDFNGALADSNGAASLTARVQNRTTGSVTTFDGPITYTTSGGGGIVLASNSGGTTDFTNATKTLNTADHDAVSMSSNTGHTLTLSGGSLDIDTTTGKGIDATGGGTINVTGSTNSINSVSARALGISATTIGSGGVLLHDVSAGNNNASADPTNGILLDNTGSTAGLTVQGSGSVAQGGDNAGGTIQRTTGDAIRLTATKSPSFNNMFLDSPGHSGVEGFDSGAGDGAHGFSFTNGKIASAGQGAANDVKDGAIAFNQITPGPADDNNVDGAVTIDNNIVTSPYGRGYDIQQNNGTISNLSIQDNALTSDNSAVTSNSHGIEVAVNGADSGGGVANVTKATIDSNNVTGFPNGHGIAVVGGNTAASAGSGTGNTFGTPDSNPNNGVDTNSVQVTNNLVHGYAGATRMTGNAIQVDVEGRGVANLYVKDNGTAASPITNSKLRPIGIGIGGAVTVDGTFDHNYVTSTTDDNGAHGIGVTTGGRIVSGPTDLDGAVARLVFNNNTVTASSGAALDVSMLSRDATEKVRITNNTLASPLQPATAGLRVQVGSNTSNGGEVPSMCAEIDSNNVGTGPVGGGGFQVPGINLYAFQPSADFKLNAWPGPFNNAGAESFVAGKNPSSATGGGTAFVGQKVAVRTGNLTASCSIGF